VVVVTTAMGWQRLVDLVIVWNEQMRKTKNEGDEILRETQRGKWLVDLVPKLVDVVLSLAWFQTYTDYQEKEIGS
jgi:hypothetical protein